MIGEWGEVQVAPGERRDLEIVGTQRVDGVDAHIPAHVWRAPEPGPTVFAEWAIDGGIDGNTRRQKNAKAPEGKFMTERKHD